MLDRRMIVLVAALALGAGACSSPDPVDQVELGAEDGSSPAAASASPSRAPDEGSAPTSGRVDPRGGGFAIGFGEYAVTLESRAIRPGPVTFVIHNGGALVHGFEMELEDGEDGGGHGGDDRFKIERPAFRPGETIRVRLDLPAGLYKIECWVENHDDLGMEALLEVRTDAPKVRQGPRTGGGDAVSVQGFAFDPAELTVPAGTRITWTNEDPAEHTVTARDGSFDSGPIGQRETYRITVDETGAITYFCSIHPSMTGTIRVA